MLRSRTLKSLAIIVAFAAATLMLASPTSSQTLRVSDTTITQGDSVTFTATQCGGTLAGDYVVAYTVTAPDSEVQELTTQQFSTPPGSAIAVQTLTIESNADTVPGLHTVEVACQFREGEIVERFRYPTQTINILAAVPDTRFDIKTPLFLDPGPTAGGAGGAGGAGNTVSTGGAGGAGGSGGGVTIGYTG